MKRKKSSPEKTESSVQKVMLEQRKLRSAYNKKVSGAWVDALVVALVVALALGGLTQWL